MNEKNDDLIRLSDIIRIIIRYKRIGISVLIICLIITTIIFMVHKPKYNYYLDLKGATYLGPTGNVKAVNCPMFLTSVNNTYASLYQQDENYFEKNNIKIETTRACSSGNPIILSMQGLKSQKDEFKLIFQKFLSNVYDNQQYLSSIEAWKKLKSSKKWDSNYSYLNSKVSPFLVNLLSAYSDQAATINKIELGSLKEKPTTIKQITMSLRPTNISKIGILIYGFIFSIFASLITIFILNMLSNVCKELKDTK